ncbi:MAG: hypothetical protein COY38_04290 [Candidatus Aenigmarchaeota archaeon CG_4_10_14_0_8_um_filter_37_24]|nr:winged helix-turn-helix transcriptional regulator [Candidatus Aenigmarchaeota archaeon]PIZ34423.1 MAG: hypothetical protein COY38_04290 [Candidatus Aenigmarchaeota archaeon CG_4_10_14_0_8_um_filter_37_24]
MVQDLGEKSIAYKTLVIKDPSTLGIISNGLGLKILKELSENPSCAMDIARKLKEHEQKIYYHIRSLEKAGLIELIGTEGRTGGTAKIYGVNYQAVSFKIKEKGQEIDDIGLDNAELLKPFVENGKLNCKIIIGDTYSHGKYDAPSTEGPYIIDIILFLGKFLKKIEFPSYKLDTTVNETDLKGNLIIFGNHKTNIIVDRINEKLPIYFDPKTENMISKKTKETYKDPRIGGIVKCLNPFNENKELLLFCGIGMSGVQSAAIAFTKHMDEILEGFKANKCSARVVKGFDADGDNVIDSVKFLE